jgi:hypothetical protein
MTLEDSLDSVIQNADSLLEERLSSRRPNSLPIHSVKAVIQKKSTPFIARLQNGNLITTIKNKLNWMFLLMDRTGSVTTLSPSLKK